MPVSDRIKGISSSPTLSLNSRVKEMKARGENVFNFTAGEPDFDTPENIKKAAVRAIGAGMTKYTPVAGTPELRQAIAAKLRRENGLEYSKEDVVVGNGGKHVLYNALMTICNPGDEVIVPSPYWVTYPEQVKLAGARPVMVPARKEEGFRLRAEDVEEKVTKKTRAIMLNSPNNPSGAVLGKKDLSGIAEIAVSGGIYVISDEIYEHLIYEGSHVPIASLGKEIKDLTVTVNGAAKAYAMTGWRIGWAAGPSDVIKGMAKLQSQTTSNANSIAQEAYREALSGSQEAVKAMRDDFRKRRDVMVEGLRSIEGIECERPGGAFYVFPDVSGCFGNGIRDSLEFSSRLLREAGVATVPGSAFGCEGHVRMSYACSEKTIRRGVSAIRDFMKTI